MKALKWLCAVVAVFVVAGLCTVDADAVEYAPFGASDPAAYLGQYVDLEEFDAYMTERLSNCVTHIDLTRFSLPVSKEMTHALYYYLSYELCDYFHIATTALYSYPSYYAHFELTYTCTPLEYKAQKLQVDGILQSMLEGVAGNDALSDAQKALILHDRTVARLSYDMRYYSDPGNEYRDLYNALVNKSCVCEGYAVVYSKLLDAVGISNSFCVSMNLAHVWNIVSIDGQLYHVDTTWDDPIYDITGNVCHDNFLRSTDGIIEAEHIKNGVVDFISAPASTLYDNAFWQSSRAEFQLLNGKIYFIDFESGMLCRLEGSGYEQIYSVDDMWRASASSYYPGCYARLSSDGVNLLFSKTSAVYAYDPDTAQVKTLWEPDLSVGSYFWIYGFTYADGYLICDLNSSPNFTATTKSLYQTQKAYTPDIHSGSCGDGVFWELDDHGILTIYGTGSTDSWGSGTKAPWYLVRDKIRYVRLRTGVTGIGAGAFGEGYDLKGVYLPASFHELVDGSFFSYAGVRFAYEGTQAQWREVLAGADSLGEYPELTHTQCGQDAVSYKENCVNQGLFCTQCNDFVTRELTRDGAHAYADGQNSCANCGYVRTARELILAQLPQTQVYDLFTQAPDLTGAVLQLRYSDATYETLDIDRVTVSGFDASQVGFVDVVLDYEGIRTLWTVQILPLDPVAIYLSDQWEHAYVENMPLDPGNFTVIAQYPQGRYVSFPASWAEAEAVTMTAGVQTLTVRCGDTQDSVELYVHSATTQVLDASTYPESEHDAQQSEPVNTTYTAQGADMLVLTFDPRTELTGDLLIYDENGRLVTRLTGQVGTQTVCVPGSSFELQLPQGAANGVYGFAFQSIEAHTAVHTAPASEADCVAAIPEKDIYCDFCHGFMYHQPAREALGHSYVNGACSRCGAGQGQCFGVYAYGARVGTLSDFDLVNTVAPDCYIRLEDDTVVNTVLEKDLYVDLNGCELSGCIDTNGYEIYGMDTATDGYSADGAGSFRCTDPAGDPVIPQNSTACDFKHIPGIYRYVTLEENGSYSFHRYSLRVTKVSLAPGSKGVSYQAVWQGSDSLLAALDGTEAVGFRLCFEQNVPVECYATAQQLESGKPLKLSVKDFDVAGYGKRPLQVSMRMKLADGTVIEGGGFTGTLYEQLQNVSGIKRSLVLRQLQALSQWVSEDLTFRAWDEELDLGWS